MFQELLVRAPASDEKRSISVWLCTHIIAASVGVALMAAVGDHPNNVPCTGSDAFSQYYDGCLSWAQVWAVFFLVVMLFVYLWAGENLVFSAARLAQWGPRQHTQSVMLLCFAFVLSLFLSILSWVALMKPGSTYQLFPNGKLKPRSAWNIDALEVLFGGLFFAAILPFSVALLLILRSSRRPRPSTRHEIRLSPVASTKRFVDSGLIAHSNRMLFLALFVLAIGFLMTTTLGPIWNFTLTYYLTHVSPYSIVFWPVGGTLPYCNDPGSNCACVFPFDLNSPISSACWFSFKIYPDTLLLYGTITACLCVGVVMRRKGWSRRVVGSRGVPRFCKPYFLGLTCVEALLLVVTAVLFLFWLLYWVLWYSRFHTTDAVHDCAYDWDGGNNTNSDSIFPCPEDTKGWSHAAISNLHVLCRASGHVASLAFALTLLPTGKHSPLLEAVGVSWERALHWHRGLGYISFICVCTHFGLWIVKWCHDGTFWKNTFNIDSQAWLWVTPVWNHFENWTIGMMELAFFGFAAAVGMAYFFRRSHYRWFYLSHSFMMVFVALALIHAWSFWYFVVPGLVIWWVDRLWRMLLASLPVSVVKIDFALEGDKLGAELVIVEIAAPHLTSNFRAGQYAFLHVPSVSRSEWHPFTMNVWGDSAVFLIKGMNPHGWTQRLKSQIREGGDTALSLPLGLLTIGPYGGVPPELLRAEKVLLVAGGIGITPVLATYQACLKAESVRWLTLVWVVREAPLVSFPLIAEALAQRRDGVEVLIYLTDPDAGDTTISAIRGRPNLRKTFTEFAAKAGRDSWSFACGPMGLQQEVEVLSEEYAFHCHVETFFF
jgi:predicted ferric reductase